jgi:4-hydroxy-tetrahydrodipicolinate synthase
MKDISKLRGSIPPIVTPFKADDSIDYDVYAGLIERQVKEGSHGVLINGTTSEPSTLTVEERKKTLEVALSVVKGRIPVVAATGSQNIIETKELCDHASKQSGVDALLVVTPYYIRPPQRGLVAYYKEICSRTDLPVMMYHIPGRAAVNATLDTIKQIREACPNFVGMKHAFNDLDFCSEQLAEFGPDYKIFVGLEELSFPMMAVGACGLMNAVGNVLPGRVAALAQAVLDNDMVTAKKIHYELFELNKAVFWDTNPTPMKYMMKKMGVLKDNRHRLPMMPATPEMEQRLDAMMKRKGLI